MKPKVIWLTGLPASGKTSIAQNLRDKLSPLLWIDGDAIRRSLCSDLGFSLEDRAENVRRAAAIARLANEQGQWVVVSLISPLKSQRQLARELVGEDFFFEVFVSCSTEVCEARDPKGLWARARSGEIVGFTGIDSPYEPPESPDFLANSQLHVASILADMIVNELKNCG